MTKTNKSIALAAAVASLMGAVQANAASFTYADNDLLLAFRPTDAGGTDVNVVFNLGNIATFKAQTGTFSVGGYASADLTSSFGDFSNLAFSSVAADDVTPYPFGIQNSVWATIPRVDINVQSSVPVRNTQFSNGQAGLAARVTAVGSNSRDNGTDLTLGTSLLNSFSGGYQGQGTSGSWGGTTAYNTENLTGASFSGVVRSDLYEILTISSGSGPATYLGYFEFSDVGAMTFTAAPVPEPTTLGLFSASGIFLFALGRRIAARKA